MTKVGIRALKDQLSRYLKRAGQGERIVITDRGKPIALLSSVSENEAARAAWSMVESGVARWQGGKPRGSASPPRIKGKTTAEVVLEDRG